MDKYDEKAYQIHEDWWAWEGTIHEHLAPMIARALRESAAQAYEDAADTIRPYGDGIRTHWLMDKANALRSVGVPAIEKEDARRNG